MVGSFPRHQQEARLTEYAKTLARLIIRFDQKFRFTFLKKLPKTSHIFSDIFNVRHLKEISNIKPFHVM